MFCTSKQRRVEAGTGTVSSWSSIMLFSTDTMGKNGVIFAR